MGKNKSGRRAERGECIVVGPLKKAIGKELKKRKL